MTLEQLQEAERRRQQKAGATTLGIPSVPGPAFETSVDAIEHRFSKIAQKAKTNREGMHEQDYRRAEMIHNLELTMNIPKRHADRTEFTGEQWKKRKDQIATRIGTGFLFALIGIRGSGKTQMGVQIIRDSVDACRSAEYTTAMDIFLGVKASFRKDSHMSEAQTVASFCKTKLLVIDEIQERAESAWEDRILTHIINKRYNDEKDTLLIGNIKQDSFIETMGASVVSRLNETGGIIVCDWESFRK